MVRLRRGGGAFGVGLAQRVPPAGGVCYAGRVLDTHAVAQSLTAVDFTPAQADAVTAALRSVVEQGDHVTSDQFKAGIAEMRAEQRGEVIEVRAETVSYTHLTLPTKRIV